MRIALALISLSLFATPASAQPIQLPPELTDPARADKLAKSMQALSRAMMDLKVGGIQAAIQGREPTPAERNLTVGDLARRNDPQIEQQIAAARPKIEQSLRALNQALPEVAADLQRAHQALQRAIANMPDPNYPRR
jgi:hypothetical protein